MVNERNRSEPTSGPKGRKASQPHDVDAALTGPRRRVPGHVLRRKRYVVSRTTWWRWRQYPDFPSPAVVGRLRLFDVEEVDRWLDGRVRGRAA